jgi:hypothetical protein
MARQTAASGCFLANRSPSFTNTNRYKAFAHFEQGPVSTPIAPPRVSVVSEFCDIRIIVCYKPNVLPPLAAPCNLDLMAITTVHCESGDRGQDRSGLRRSATIAGCFVSVNRALRGNGLAISLRRSWPFFLFGGCYGFSFSDARPDSRSYLQAKTGHRVATRRRNCNKPAFSAKTP